MAPDNTALTTSAKQHDGTSSLTRRQTQAGSLVPMGSELAAMKEWAEIWVASGMLPKQIVKAEQALAIMFAARDLGLKPTAAFKGLYLVNGKVAMEFQTMNALVQAKLPGYELQVMERSKDVCRLRGRRHSGHEWTEIAFTITEAAAANLTTGDVWKKYPADMLFAKAGERLLRVIASDVLLGIAYDSEEMVVITGKEQPTLNVTEQSDAMIIDATNFEEVPVNGGE